MNYLDSIVEVSFTVYKIFYNVFTQSFVTILFCSCSLALHIGHVSIERLLGLADE